MSKEILITGALGQLGNAVIDQLKQRYELISTDIIQNNSLSNYQYLDVTDKNQINEFLREYNPKIIINLAAYTDVDLCELEPERAEALNTNAVKYLVNNYEGKFIQISTDYVFDGTNGPYNEEDKTNPINVYGKTKLESEDIITEHLKDWCIIRTNVLYDHYYNTKASFIKWIIDSLNSNNQINVVDDQWNNPIWTKNLAEVIELVIERDVKGLYHYGGPDYLSRYDFALLIANIFGLDKKLIKPISTASLNQTAKRPLKGGLKSNKIEDTLNIKSYKLIDCLKEIKSRNKE